MGGFVEYRVVTHCVVFIFPIEITNIFPVLVNGEVNCQYLAVQKAD